MLEDARRFVLTNTYIADIAPLQLYSSCMIFAPQQTLTRQSSMAPGWIQSLPKGPKEWGVLVQTLESHTSRVMRMLYLPSNNLLVSAAKDNTIKVWDVKTGVLQQTIQSEITELRSLVCSSDEGLLIVFCSGKFNNYSLDVFPAKIELCDIRYGRILQTLHLGEDDVRVIALSPDGKFLAAGSEDGTINLWNLTSKRLHSPRVIGKHVGSFLSLAFSPDGKLLISGVFNDRFRLWTIDSRRAQYQTFFENGRGEPIAFLKSDDLLITCSEFGIKLWRISLTNLKYRHAHAIWLEQIKQSALSFDEKQLTVESWDTLNIFNVTPERFVLQHSIKTGMLDIASLVYVSYNGLLAFGSPQGPIRLWDANLAKAPADEITEHSKKVTELIISSDSELLISGSIDIKIWKRESEKLLLLHEISGREANSWSTVRMIALAPGNKLIASSFPEGTTILSSTVPGKPRQTLKADSIYVNCLAFSSDGKFLISGSPETYEQEHRTVCRLWNTASWDLERTRFIPDLYCDKIACSSDGKLLALSQGQRIELWDIINRQRRSIVVCLETVNWLCFHEEYSQLETNVAIFYIQGNRIVSVQRARKGGFDVQGAWIVSGGQRLVWLPSEHRSAFASQGDMIALGSHYGAITTFELSSSELERAGILEDDQVRTTSKQSLRTYNSHTGGPSLTLFVGRRSRIERPARIIFGHPRAIMARSYGYRS